ncbi:MAG: shikimate kinase [Thermodesulfobacteriota bacterium]
MNKISNIYLVGFMGSGKTTVGRLLSKKIGFLYIDLDKKIEKNEGLSISQIIQRFGEERFRELESELLSTISIDDCNVIATGGGIVIKDINWDYLNKSGVVIYLKADIDQLWNRVKKSNTRPLLRVENPYLKFKELFNSRETLYLKADLTIDTSKKSVNTVVDELACIIKTLKKIINSD